MAKLWIMGCGDIGRRVAKLYQKDGVTATGWVNSVDSVQAGQAEGITMRRGDIDAGCFFPRILFEGADIFWFMPPPRSGEVDSRLRRFLSTVQDAPRRIVLISTTGVYGDCEGRWIDESEPLRPVADRAKRRTDAEAALQAWAQAYSRDRQLEWVTLRVPGIYAQERLPLARLQRGEPVLKADEAPWTNRIHADDLALVCKRAMDIAPSGSIYNATDGSPSTMTDYFNQVADYAGLPRPPQVALADAQNVMSKGMMSYMKESRRIRNDKLLKELGITLQYPSLETAIRAFSATLA